MERNEYDEQAEQFLTKYGFEVKAAHKGDKCPEWGGDPKNQHGGCYLCGSIHGDRYRVTIKRVQWKSIMLSETKICPNGHTNCLSATCYLEKKGQPRSISFDFWGSRKDQEDGKTHLRPYSVLACISSDATLPTDPDELISELGPMPVKRALVSVAFTKKLQAFFTEAEIDALSEIR